MDRFDHHGQYTRSGLVPTYDVLYIEFSNLMSHLNGFLNKQSNIDNFTPVLL